MELVTHSGAKSVLKKVRVVAQRSVLVRQGSHNKMPQRRIAGTLATFFSHIFGAKISRLMRSGLVSHEGSVFVYRQLSLGCVHKLASVQSSLSLSSSLPSLMGTLASLH